MSEILFRGKGINDGKWIEGYVIRGWIYDDKTEFAGIVPLPTVQSPYDMTMEMNRIIPETISEFTGLTDKNGKKIFEGDILATIKSSGDSIIEGVVKYGDFNCSCCNGVYGWYVDGGDIRKIQENDWYFGGLYIIGNIHDNPELLKEEKGMRYIDADKLLNNLPDDLPYKASVKRVLIQAPTEDVVPKSEVEKWKEINEQLYKEMSERMIEERKIERNLVAREIFEEIDELLVQNATMQIATSTLHCKLAELKKKYTESESNV